MDGWAYSIYHVNSLKEGSVKKGSVPFKNSLERALFSVLGFVRCTIVSGTNGPVSMYVCLQLILECCEGCGL